MVEKELKSLLTFDQYQELKSKLNWNCIYSQTNFYYDTDDQYCLYHGITIRIRKKKDSFFLQVKIPVSTEGGLHIKQEYEKQIHAIPKTISANELTTLIGMPIPTVKQIGSLITERAEYSVADTLVCLDRNEYMGKEDFEIEIEYESQPDYGILALTNELGVDFRKKSLGKFTRFNLIASSGGTCL